MHDLNIDPGLAVGVLQACGELLGFLVEFGWVAGVGFLLFGALTAHREHLSGLTTLLVSVGVACCAVSIIGTLMPALTGLAANMVPQATD